jgi:hypothetical protein
MHAKEIFLKELAAIGGTLSNKEGKQVSDYRQK